MEKGDGYGEGRDKIFNLEKVEYQLEITVNGDNGKFIEPFLVLTDYKTKTSSVFSGPVCFEAIQNFEEHGQKITNNKLLEFVSVENIGKVKRLILTWNNYDKVKRVLRKWTNYGMIRFPLEICVFEELQELKIYSRKEGRLGSGLRHIPPEIKNLKNLRLLHFFKCPFLEDLPSEIGKLEKLEELVISECDSLIHLPPEIGNLKRLRKLVINSCKKLEDLPSTICNLESLEGLSVNTWQKRLTFFPSGMSNLKRLRFLYIKGNYCESSRPIDIMFSLPNLENLQILKISCCDSLVHLPPEIGDLRCLQRLWIERCDGLEALPSEVGNLESLQEMMIFACSRINNLPPEIGNLRCLRKLEIKEGLISLGETFCLQSIPLEVRNLVSLQEFEISYCGCLERLALVISKLQWHLQRLKIDYRRLDRYCHMNYPVTHYTRVCFDLKFTMTLEELAFERRGSEYLCSVEILNFLQSLAAENSPSLPMSYFLPQGIRCIKIDFPSSPIRPGSIDQETIYKLLQKYPRLGRVSCGGEILDDLSTDSYHMMYLNRFGRSLQYESNTSGDRSLPTFLAGNILPIILEEAQIRIEEDTEDMGDTFGYDFEYITEWIMPSVIYSIVREIALPLLLDH